MNRALKISEIINKFNLEILVGNNLKDLEIIFPEWYDPVIELSGHVNLSSKSNLKGRVHIIDTIALKYFITLSNDDKKEKLYKYFSNQFDCIIIFNKKYIDEIFLTLAKIHNKVVLYYNDSVKDFKINLSQYLYKNISKFITTNKYILIDVFGTGVLLTGVKEAKRAAAIDLLERDHRLVASKYLNIGKLDKTKLIGEVDSSISKEECYTLKLNNKEKLNVLKYFGAGAVRRKVSISLIIDFEMWDDLREYDRLGLETKSINILDCDIPIFLIPVKMGRNLSILVEAAVMNYRAKLNGENATEVFFAKTEKLIFENKKRRKEFGVEFVNALTLFDLQNRFQLKSIFTKGRSFKQIEITSSELYNPSLEFLGVYDTIENFKGFNIHFITKKELLFLQELNANSKLRNLKRYLSYNTFCLIFDADLEIPNYLVKLLKDSSVETFQLNKNITSMRHIKNFLNKSFALTTTVHGVFVEVYGFGVLITGKSGIGKSEAALELIRRKHRLISDDSVKFIKEDDGSVTGVATQVGHYIEIRGLGILDTKMLHGVGSVKNDKRLNLVINLSEYRAGITTKNYEDQEVEILGEVFKKIDIYIYPGRNIASMIEIATMNILGKSKI